MNRSSKQNTFVFLFVVEIKELLSITSQGAVSLVNLALAHLMVQSTCPIPLELKEFISTNSTFLTN